MVVGIVVVVVVGIVVVGCAHELQAVISAAELGDYRVKPYAHNCFSTMPCSDEIWLAV